MALWRDIKNKARMVVHEHLFVPAYYFVPVAAPQNPFDPDTEAAEYAAWVMPPKPHYAARKLIKVRIHTKFDALGDMTGTNYHYAEKQEITPKILFMRSEVEKPVRNSVVAVAEGEAYNVDNSLPPDGISVTAEVTRLLEGQFGNLTYPEV